MVLGQAVNDIQVFVLIEQVQAVERFVAHHFHRALVDDHIALVIDDGFEFFGRKAQQVPNFIGQGLKEPDMHDGHDQFDMAHAFAAHLFFRYFDAAAVAHDTLVADSLVFAAVALVVFYRSEYTLAEQAVAFGFVGAVVDGFRFQHLPIGALQDLVGRGQADGDAVEILTLQVCLFL